MFLIESMIVGGAERVLINLVNSLSPDKYDITVISVFKQSVYEGYDCAFVDILPTHVHYKYLVDNSNSFKYKLFNVAFHRGNKRLLHKLLIGDSYDVEIAWYEGMPTTFLSHSSNTKSRKLAWLHYGDGFANLQPTQKKRYLQEYSAYDQIVGVSRGVCKNFEERLGKEFSLTTRYNVLDDAEIRQKADAFEVARGTELTFVSVGRLTPVKGYDRLLRVCGRLQSEGFDFRLWIIGEGGERSSLEKLLRELELSDKVQMFGNRDNPYPYMKTADWFISSSYAEGFSTVLTEACILGTPMISTRCLGTAEMLGENGEYGLMADNSEEGIYIEMHRVLKHLELHDACAEKVKVRSSMWKKDVLLNRIEQVL